VRTVERHQVERLLTPEVCIDAMRTAFLRLHARQVVAPDEFVMHHPSQGDVHIKGAYLSGSEWMVAKVATAGFQEGGNNGASFGINASTGRIEVVVADGGLMTELRTAAAVALSVDLLARQDSKSLLMIGCGAQAGFQLDAIRGIRKWNEVRVHGRNPCNLAPFAERHRATSYLSLTSALDNVDVVLLATTSREPILVNAADISLGVHITTSGADMVGKAEIGAEVIRSADIVAVDDIDLAHRVGLLQPTPDYEAATIGQILSGQSQRSSNQQRSICGLVGLGVQDAAIFEALMSAL
jgi:ornithine cyclodeaminase